MLARGLDIDVEIIVGMQSNRYEMMFMCFYRITG